MSKKITASIKSIVLIVGCFNFIQLWNTENSKRKIKKMGNILFVNILMILTDIAQKEVASALWLSMISILMLKPLKKLRSK